MFEIIVDDTVVQTCDTVEEAKTAVAGQKRWFGPDAKVRMRKYAPEQADIDLGRQREAARMADGTYKPLPEWFPTLPDHYAHFSTDPDKARRGWVAYTPSDEFFASDRQITLLASSYLAKWFPDMSSEDVSQMHSRLRAHMSHVTYKITGDAAEIYAAYRASGMNNESSAAESCMKYEFGGRSTHPSRVYGGKASLHLAVGYDVGGTPICRALVCQKHRTFVRVYGPAEHVREGLVQWLEDNDYERSDDFEGSTILKLRVAGNKYLMPYIDGDAQCVEDYRRDNDLWLIGCDGYDAAVTGGAIYLDEDEDEDEDTFECDRCGDIAPNDDQHSVVTSVQPSGHASVSCWCRRCEAHYTWTCDRTGESVSDDLPSMEVFDDTGIEYSWLESERQHTFVCEYTNRRYDRGTCTPVDVQPPEGEARLSDTPEVWCLEQSPLDQETRLPLPGAWAARPRAQTIADPAQTEMAAL